MKKLLSIALLFIVFNAISQNVLTPELMWKLGRVSALGVSKDKQWVIYSVTTPDVTSNKSTRKIYKIAVKGGVAEVIENADTYIADKNISPDGKYILSNQEVKVKKVLGSDYYPELDKSNVQIYDSLMIRHWDTWEDGKFDHVFFAPIGNSAEAKDIMPEEPYDCPTKPFGGDEDYTWSPDGKEIVFATKKKFGTAYALSTNTDIYAYNIANRTTRNLTIGMMGYDLAPAFNSNGALAWLSMRRDGYEADKQDIIVMKNGKKTNLTALRDDIHVESFKWSDDGNSIYFVSARNGTEQLFSVNYDGTKPIIKQITSGDFDITGIVGQSDNTLIVSRTDFNSATELFTVDIATGKIKKLTYVNDAIYATIEKSRTERRFVTTTDGKQMLVWIVYPPNFDPTKKYPTLLFCEGGPQTPLTQFYSFRWNFQLMAANGYIIVAPNRRGMPGHGTKWNEEISKDWGGQVMKDYLSAIDAFSKEKFVDKSRLGAVGASYGGYSVYFLAGIHNKRFKTFISHDGVFDLRSMYGTTEELWFPNWEHGGSYWDKSKSAQKTYSQFNPINFVDKWNTPILIIQGGKDYRVPIEQGLQAFTAAQLQGIKSRLLFLPDENHWVLQAQNALVWQHEFYRWLKETL